jgi:trimeric autotransporter adhesin
MKKGIFLIYFLFLNHVSAQTISTIVGTGVANYSGDGGPAISCTLNQPSWIEFDSDGAMYIADFLNSSIRKINTSGIISTVAGTGVAGYSGDGGLATDAKLNAPIGFCIDNIGNVYIADYEQHVIRKVDATGVISTFAGTGSGGYSGDGGPASNAQLKLPYGIVADGLGNLYFSEVGNSCVRKINVAGIISTIAGNGTYGYSGDGGQATNAQFRYPSYISLNLDGDLFISDWVNRRIRKLNILTGIITTVAGNGTEGNSGDGGPATAAQLNAPNSVNFDDSGNFYICDNFANVIRKVSLSGIITTIAGTGTAGSLGDGGPAISAQLNTPNCAIFDTWGNLYTADTKNNRIRRINFKTSSVVEVTNNRLNVTISPNPACNEITISANDNIKTIAVVNMLGQVVIETNNNKKQMVIDIRFLSPGLYTVKVNNAYAGRFVKE